MCYRAASLLNGELVSYDEVLEIHTVRSLTRSPSTAYARLHIGRAECNWD